MSGDQRRTYIDTAQTYETCREACDEAGGYAGTMHWKTVGDRAYLYHRFSRRSQSLGPRNAETETQYHEFTEGKATTAERVAAVKERLKVQGAMARAVRIDRVPSIAAKLLQAVNDEPDPRAFVRHKLGLSTRIDRERKQRRDPMMAEAVAHVVLEYLPQFPMNEGDLRGFTAPVRRKLEAIA